MGFDMKYKIDFSKQAEKQFAKLGGNTQQQITNFFDNHITNGKDPRSSGKPLSNNMKGKWRYRVGNFRIVCEIKDDKLIVLVIDIDTRDKVYKENLNEGHYVIRYDTDFDEDIYEDFYGSWRELRDAIKWIKENGGYHISASAVDDYEDDIEEGLDENSKGDFEVEISLLDDEAEPIKGTETKIPVTRQEVIDKYSEKTYNYATRGYNQSNAKDYVENHRNTDLAQMIGSVADEKFRKSPNYKTGKTHFQTTQISLINPSIFPTEEEQEEEEFSKLRQRLTKILMPPRGWKPNR